MGLSRGMAGFHQVLKTSIHCFVQGTRSSILNFSNISAYSAENNKSSKWLVVVAGIR